MNRQRLTICFVKTIEFIGLYWNISGTNEVYKQAHAISEPFLFSKIVIPASITIQRLVDVAASDIIFSSATNMARPVFPFVLFCVEQAPGDAALV